MRTVSSPAGEFAGPPPIPPGIVYWYGRATGAWWAVVPGRGGPRLVEAVSRDALAATVHWHLRCSGW